MPKPSRKAQDDMFPNWQNLSPPTMVLEHFHMPLVVGAELSVVTAACHQTVTP